MHRYVLAALVVLVSSVQCAAQIPEQAHDPTKCSASDVACVKAWFDEYKVGILEELDDYKSLEDRVATDIAAGDDMDANRLTGLLMDRGWYRHNHWALADAAQLINAGIPFDDYEGLIACRTAIINMKYMIIAAAAPRDASQDRSDYLENVGLCEKAFHLKPTRSALRRHR